MELVAADIGGTHARFAIACVEGGRVTALGDPITLKSHDYASLQRAWQAFGEQLGRPLPRAAAIAIASPIGGEVLKMTNNPWVIRPALVQERLEVDEYVLVNDFGAIGHAVAHAPPEQFGLVLSKGSALTTCVSAAVDALRTDGTLAALEKKWLTGAGAPKLS